MTRRHLHSGLDGGFDDEPSQTGVPRSVPRLASSPLTAGLTGHAGLRDLGVLPDGVPLEIEERAAGGEAEEDARASAQLAPPTPAAMLDTVLWLSRELTVDLDGRQMVARFLRAVRLLLPGRDLCVRLLDGPQGGVAQVALGGPLLPEQDVGEHGEGRVRVLLKRSALARLHLRADVEDTPGVQLADHHQCLFAQAVWGFSVPIAAAGDLYGSIYVEYPAPREREAAAAVAEGDEPAVIALANHLAVSLRNVRLVHETRFLRDYLARIIEHARALILAVDRDGTVTVLNQTMARALGVRRRDVLGTRLSDLDGRGEAFEALREGLLQALEGSDPGPLDVILYPREGGRSVRAVFNITGIGGGAGCVPCDAAVAIGQDQTALRHLEGQVIQAEKLATLGQLAAGVVHEINNPLTSIVAYADYLAKKYDRHGAEAPGREDVERLRMIATSAERIQNFTRDLVQYARPAPEQREPIALGDVVLQALSFCEHVVEKSGARVSRVMASDLPPIRGIKGQLQQVFINLITNACHALPPGGGEITLTTFVHDEGHVAARVVDDGSGIRPEIIGQIFEPFFSTKTQGKGTGLGLSIVRNIVDTHQGRIEVESAPTKGSSFTVILPVLRRQPAKALERIDRK